MSAAPLLVYEENRVRVLQGLRAGRFEYADLTSWSFMDKFLALWIDRGFFTWAEQTFPSPRQRHHVPVWFLLAAYTQLKLHTEGAFHRLPYVLRSASVLRTLGVQLGVPGGDGGFNRRHRKPRRSPVDQDTVRKFMKDTDTQALQAWYAVDVVAWLRGQRLFEVEGVDILDATLLPTPDNPHYEESAVVPLTKEGHYPRDGEATVPTRCYKVTSLLHVVAEGAGFFYRGVHVGPGTASALTVGEALVDVARQVPGRGALRLLLCDREFCACGDDHPVEAAGDRRGGAVEGWDGRLHRRAGAEPAAGDGVGTAAPAAGGGGQDSRAGGRADPRALELERLRGPIGGRGRPGDEGRWHAERVGST